MADHLELVAEIPKVEKLCVQDRLELARKRRSQQLKRWDREKDEELGPPPPKKKPLRARPVKFEPRIILLEAASRGDGDEVKKMLDYGVDPNLSNDDGLTALHQACIDECEDIAALLVEYGADIDAYDRELWTPLHASAACGNFSMIEYLVDQGANVAAINADGNLPVDLVEDDKELKDYLYDELDKHGFDEDKIDELMIQREHWMMEDIQDAIEKKRDLEIKDMEGATALHVAAANGYMEVLEFLLEHDADVDVKDKDGWMPIHAAGCWGNEKAIELLVEHGADIDSKTPRGESPLDLCEDADTRQFIIDLKNKMKTNKFKVKKTRRQRSNSRSLSVKRSSLKEKISISQSEAKAEAIMRKHPELAFLIQNDKKSNGEPKPEDINIDEKDGKHTEETVSPEKKHVPTDERKPLSKESSNVNERTSTTTTTTTITTKPERISENREKRLVDIKVVVKGTEEKENKPLVEPKNRELPKLEQYKGPEPGRREATVQEKHVTPTQDIKTTDVQSKNQPAPKESILQERTNIAPSEFSKIHGPPKCPPPRSPTLGHRQLPADPTPKLPQTTKENEATQNNQLGQGAVISKVQKAPTPKPLSEVSLNKKTTEGSPTPKSSKTRAAPPVPRSSGSASGRSQVPLINSSSDTSGYPESFSKRKSRDSRELSDATMQQLAKDVKESRAASISDVKMTSHTARYTPKPPTPPQQPQRNDVATLDVHSDTANAKQMSAESNNTNINNQPKEPVDKISAQANVKVERQKKSCCILM